MGRVRPFEASRGGGGLRLASDMVRTTWDRFTWVIEHPDWFISRWRAVSGVQLNGDLSTDSRVEIKIDDHYYDQSDAAVTFRLRHHASARRVCVPRQRWDDVCVERYGATGLLEGVCARACDPDDIACGALFPIIRFDAAMVLAKRHVQRLCFLCRARAGRSHRVRRMRCRRRSSTR